MIQWDINSFIISTKVNIHKSQVIYQRSLAGRWGWLQPQLSFLPVSISAWFSNHSYLVAAIGEGIRAGGLNRSIGRHLGPKRTTLPGRGSQADAFLIATLLSINRISPWKKGSVILLIPHTLPKWILSISYVYIYTIATLSLNAY